MENWFQDVGRAALLKALGDTCDRINDSFKTDFETYNQTKLLNLGTELETLRHEASQVHHLRDENVKLKDEIKALKEASYERTPAPDTSSHKEAKSALRTPLAPRSTNQLNSNAHNKANIEHLTLAELRSEFLRIDKKHSKLYEKYLALREALSKSNELVRDRTTMYDHWVDHAKQLSEQSLKRAQRIKKLEAKLAEICQEPLNLSFSDAGDVEMAPEPAIPTPIQPRQREDSNIATPTLAAVPRYQPRASACTDGTGTSKSPLIARSAAEIRHPGPILGTGDLTKTNDIAPCLPPLPQNREPTKGGHRIKSEPSSDSPIVVSERCVRKRKYVASDGGDVGVSIKLKIEHSPEPRSGGGAQHFTPHESIDFDTEYCRVETPRKHAKYQHNHNAHLDKDVDVQAHDYNARNMHTDKLVKYDRRKPGSDVSTMDPAAANSTVLQNNVGSALQTPNNNRPLRPRLNLGLDSRNRKFSEIPRGLASLAEDGYPSESISFSDSRNGPKVDVLERLLNTQSPTRENGAPGYSRPTKDGQPTNLEFQLPRRRELPFGKDGRKGMGLVPKGGSNMLNHGVSSLPLNQDGDKETIMSRMDQGKTGVPLRQIQKTRLRLDDFKINPDVNEGYNYAFSDVVRKKDDRACLQGCVKENCCGRKFRALAHASRAGTGSYEFRSLLESYLGDDCRRLSTMSESEKETLWIEAKMRELANASGKHRHRYARMSTPPGFWRADFPSTQEGEEYSEEAAKLELELIEERYREAMRPGGLWVFRD
ncbi:DNA repair protein endonuclease SAE2/CtIP C-terminus-domain-containing protein, partial [Xylaria grammica]